MSDDITSDKISTDHVALYDKNIMLNLYPFVCGLCSEKFNNIVAFLVHLKQHKLDKFKEMFFHSCRSREQRNESNEQSVDSMFKCGGCLTVFPSVCTLHDHITKVERTMEYTIQIQSRTAVFNTFKAQTRDDSLTYRSDHMYGSQNSTSESQNLKEIVSLECSESVEPGENFNQEITSEKSCAQDMPDLQEKDVPLQMQVKVQAVPEMYANPSCHKYFSNDSFNETADVEKIKNLTSVDDIPHQQNDHKEHDTSEDSGAGVCRTLQSSPGLDHIDKTFTSRGILMSCLRTPDDTLIVDVTEVTDYNKESVTESDQVKDSEKTFEKDLGAHCHVQNHSVVNDSRTEHNDSCEVDICDDNMVIPKKLKEEISHDSETVVTEIKIGKFNAKSSDITVYSRGNMGELQGKSYSEKIRDSKKERRRVQMMKYQREYRMRKHLKDRIIWSEGDGKELHLKKQKSTENGREKTGVRSSEVKVPCDVCGLIFKKRNLNRHKESHRDDKAFECEICQKTFRTKSQLKGHQLHHRTERDLICQYCGKAFNNGPNLRQHIKTHTRSRDLQCHLCPKQFSSAYVLRDHVARHSDTKPHSCEICHRNFKMSHEVLRHMSTVHSKERPYQCNLCQKAFKTKSNLVKHQKTHTHKKNSN